MALLTPRGLKGPVLLCLAALCGWHAPAAAEPYSADAVKAAYLYRFTDYVGWPEKDDPAAPFEIVVVGAPAVARELRRLLAMHDVKGRGGRVREIATVADLGAPKIVYLGPGAADFLRRAEVSGDRRPILWVSDQERGLELGSMLNFLSVDHRVRFEISLTAADRAGLSISSDLLSVAARVDGDRRRARIS